MVKLICVKFRHIVVVLAAVAIYQVGLLQSLGSYSLSEVTSDEVAIRTLKWKKNIEVLINIRIQYLSHLFTYSALLCTDA